MPSTNVAFWKAKFEANVLRDRCALEALTALGWKTAVVWECALQKSTATETLEKLVCILSDGSLRQIEIGSVDMSAA